MASRDNLSASEKHRLEGNCILASINSSAVTKESHIARLKESLVCYNRAVNSARNYEELSSAHKNCSASALKIFKLCVLLKSGYTTCRFYMEDFVTNNSQAVMHGRSCMKPAEWIKALKKRAHNGVTDYEIYLKSALPFGQQVEALLRLLALRKQANAELNVHLLFNLSCLYLNQSVAELESKNTRASSSSVNESSFYFEECGKTLRECLAVREADDKKYYYNKFLDAQHSNMDGLGKNLTGQMVLVSGTFFKEKADKSIKSLMSSVHDSKGNVADENIELAWDTIDLYRVAIVQTKGKHLELEAEVLSQIGYIYEQVLCEDAKAKACFYSCFNICESMRPKTFKKMPWFIRCERSIQKYQAKVVNKENERHEAEKMKVIDEIKVDLEEIVKAGKNMTRKQFLTFLYTEYAPKNAKHTLKYKINNDGELKKAYKTALIHYHPDKNRPEKYGHAWYFISEQCAKELSCIYEGLKANEDSQTNYYT